PVAAIEAHDERILSGEPGEADRLAAVIGQLQIREPLADDELWMHGISSSLRRPTWVSATRRGHREREVTVGVDVPPLEPEPRVLEHGLRGGPGELVGTLRPDALVRREGDPQPQAAEVHLLRAVGDEVHLDAGLGLIVEGEVAE